MQKQIFLLALSLTATLSQEDWVWSRNDRSQRGFSDRQDVAFGRLASPFFGGRQKEREPTTKRPQTQSDVYDLDSPDEVGLKRFSLGFGDRRQGQLNGYPGGYQQGFNPLKGHPANGILVGPGGPTGIIGRPPGSYGNGGFPFGGQQGGGGGGFPFGGQQGPQAGGFPQFPNAFPAQQGPFQGPIAGQFPLQGPHPGQGPFAAQPGYNHPQQVAFGHQAAYPHPAQYPNQQGGYPGFHGQVPNYPQAQLGPFGNSIYPGGNQPEYGLITPNQLGVPYNANNPSTGFGQQFDELEEDGRSAGSQTEADKAGKSIDDKE